MGVHDAEGGHGGWFGTDFRVGDLEAGLNGFGAEGWELVSVFDVNLGDGRTAGIVAVLKRPETG